ncbi:MAG: PEP-utilizing enzyme [Candidatus Pacebacteria bacterium]|jgi:phosphohistidine swiveling domain-containing protein|nr:PEP-utilizing enzyme [Candidatus Paceibacterota bacterium]
MLAQEIKITDTLHIIEISYLRTGAILIENGNILSHMAIVAREFKKPCIIGIDNLTKILKDGDLVEVDADTGIVRILKSSLIS